MTAGDNDILPCTRGNDASDRLSVDGEFNFEGVGVPELQGAVIRNRHQLPIVQLQHLVYARVVLLDRLDRLKLDALVGVRDAELRVLLQVRVGLAQEVDRFLAQLGQQLVDVVLVGVVGEDFDLGFDVRLLVLGKLVCRLLG